MNLKAFDQQIEEIRRERPSIYHTITLDLTNARSEVVFSIAGNYFNVIEATDLNVNLQVRFNEISADTLTFKKRQGVKIPFYRLFITNEGQAGKSITIAYGINEAPFELIDQAAIFQIQGVANQESSTPTFQTFVCTLAATEYNRTVPDGTKKFTIKARGGDVQVSFTATQSSTNYILLKDGQSWSEDLVYLTGDILYVQSPTAGTTVEFIAWV